MGRALKGAFESGDEAGVLVGDDQPHPGQPTTLQRGQEAAPEHLVLAVTHVQAEDFPAAVGGDPGGHHDRLRRDVGGGVAHVQVGRVQVDVGELDVVEPSGPKRGHDLVQAGADAADLGLGDARVDPQRRDQIVHRAGGHAGDVRLHHHRVQRLVDAAAWLERDHGPPPTPSQARLAMSGPVLWTPARLFYVEIAERGGNRHPLEGGRNDMISRPEPGRSIAVPIEAFDLLKYRLVA
jgi:hypothetical protein